MSNEAEYNLFKYGVSIPLSKLNNTQIQQIQKKLTIRIKVSIPGKRSYIQTTNNYIKDRKYIFVPRWYAINTNLSFGNLLKNDFKPIDYNYVGKLFPYQQTIIDYLVNNYYNPNSILKGSGCCNLKLGTGLGKTYIAMNLINLLKLPTLIITHNSYMLGQWKRALQNMFPYEEIGEYHGKCKNIQNITIGIINSCRKDKMKIPKDSLYVDKEGNKINNPELFVDLKINRVKRTIDISKHPNKNKQLIYDRLKNIKTRLRQLYDFINEEDNITDLDVEDYIFLDKFSRKLRTAIKETDDLIETKSDNFYNNFGFIIFDELHGYTGAVDRKIFTNSQSICMLGLSASLDMKEYPMLKYIIDRVGPIVDYKEIPGINIDDVKFNADVHVIEYSNTDKYNQRVLNADGVTMYLPTAKILVKDPNRNKLILEKLLSIKDHNIFVLTIFREHVLELYRIISKHLPVMAPELTEDEIVNIMGGATIDEIDKKTDKKIIISTYKYSGTGISIDRMTALIVAAPIKKEILQVAGRIFRINKEFNNIRRKIIDINDVRSSLKTQFNTRRSEYNRRGLNITYEVYEPNNK